MVVYLKRSESQLSNTKKNVKRGERKARWREEKRDKEKKKRELKEKKRVEGGKKIGRER